ncbi:MAG: hypothetical protein RSB86_10140 [Comamonas sp.]|uniref:hypothetical protein n=1 Tax=Comamonas sp. TaxID=34028 RepID=UPI002FCC763A
MKKLVVFACFAASATAFAAPFQGSIQETIEEMADFSAENNTFAVIKKQPLHIRLSPRVVKGDLPETVKSEVLRAATYGVYRTFTHIKENQVQVAVQSVLFEVGPSGAKLTLTKSPSATVTVTRAQAQKVAQDVLGANSLNSLVDASDGWSDKMINGRYFGRKPGLQKLSDALGIKYTP